MCISPFFWLTAAALGWSGDIQPIQLVIWIGCVLVSILVHELGHALTARYFGANNIRIILHGMGGQAVSSASPSRTERLTELLCGPGAGFLLLGIILLVSPLLSLVFHNSLWYFTRTQLIYINLYWSLLNLLPILPLDGGQIMYEFVRSKKPWDGKDVTMKISFFLSGFLALALLISATISMFRGTQPNWYPPIIFTFLAIINYQMYKFKYTGEENQLENEIRKPWERDPDWWKN